MHGRKPERSSASLERKSSFLSDGTFESISESETSTAPSSLQTIVRAPYANSISQYAGMSEYDSSPESSSPTQVVENIKEKPTSSVQTFETRSLTTDSEIGFSSANNLRKVSEQILSSSRSRTSLSLAGSRPGSIAVGAGSPRDPGSRLPGPSSIGQSSSSGSDSRPNSQLSLAPSGSRPNSQLGHSSRIPQLPNLAPGKDLRPNSYAGPPNTVGLPSVVPGPSSGLLPQTSSSSIRNLSYKPQTYTNQPGPKFQSKLPRLSSDSDQYPESGLLSTISQAAMSDDDSPPATHISSPPKFNTASLAKPSSKIPGVQPNYENVEKQNGFSGMKPSPGAGIPRPSSRTGLPARVGSPVQGMTQGQFRAAASQAKVSTIPEDPGTYIPMGMRKGTMVPRKGMIPLATSSPSGIPTFHPNSNGHK